MRSIAEINKINDAIAKAAKEQEETSVSSTERAVRCVIDRQQIVEILKEHCRVVPFPNDWNGSEREQLIFGKGIVAGLQLAIVKIESA